MGVLVIRVLVFTVVLFCLYCVFILFRLCIPYSSLFCLHYCEDYCHRMKTQTQLIIIIIIIIIITQVNLNRNIKIAGRLYKYSTKYCLHFRYLLLLSEQKHNTLNTMFCLL